MLVAVGFLLFFTFTAFHWQRRKKKKLDMFLFVVDGCAFRRPADFSLARA
jgi:hypothetical protein